MSPVDAPHGMRPSTCAGYTALEIAMTLVLVSLMTLVIEGAVSSANRIPFSSTRAQCATP